MPALAPRPIPKLAGRDQDSCLAIDNLKAAITKLEGLAKSIDRVVKSPSEEKEL